MGRNETNTQIRGEKEETHKAKISALVALVVIGLMFTATAVSVTSASANSSNLILANLTGSMSAATSSTNSKSVSITGSTTILAKSFDGWNLTVNGVTFGAYSNLKQYSWVTARPPYGPYDEIGLVRLVDPSQLPSKGVVFINPGTWSSGDQLLTNPPGSPYNTTENFSIAPYLANRGFDVYSINYRTHYVPENLNLSNLSFMQNWGWDQWIGDIKAAVEATKVISGANKIYMAGESFGGIAAMNYASLYWAQDLKGIILLDGGPGGKVFSAVTNTDNLTQDLNLMNLAGLWAMDVYNSALGATPGGRSLYLYAIANPNAPANATGAIPTNQTNNPITGQPWANLTITDFCAYVIYTAIHVLPGAISNIYPGYGNASIDIRIESTFDRWWPNRLGLETTNIQNWNNSPYVTFDFDDHYIQINVPLLSFTSGKFGLILFGLPVPNGIANPDITENILFGFGHLDVYAGVYSAGKVNVPTYQWLISHRMLIGFGIINSNNSWTSGKTTIFINASTINLETDSISAIWSIVSQKSLSNLEVYKGTGELGNISIVISSMGPAAAIGSGVIFVGKLV
ncbi:MAG: hypothetical protein WED07_01335 [Candidatus Freyarchaeum deiterrae]